MFVVQIVMPLYSSSAPLCSWPSSSDPISAKSASPLPTLIRANSASETIRRLPSCSSWCRGRDHASGMSRMISGTTRTIQPHHGTHQRLQCARWATAASAICSAMIRSTAGAASQRDSSSASCRFSSPMPDIVRATPRQARAAGDHRTVQRKGSPSRRRRRTATLSVIRRAARRRDAPVCDRAR